jgi:hypothetical protein
MTNSEYLQLATLLVVIVYTFVTYRLLAAQSRQGFENTFFKLLSLHHEIVGAIEMYVGELPVRGRRNFSTFYGEFVSNFQLEYKKDPSAGSLQVIQAAYEHFFESRQSDIGHYFRSLYHIIKYVHQSKKPDKDFYAHLVRAQLSSSELLLLFYNCLSTKGIEKFKPLVEKYSLLENMPEKKLASDILQLPDHRKLYDQNAFSKD